MRRYKCREAGLRDGCSGSQPSDEAPAGTREEEMARVRFSIDLEPRTLTPGDLSNAREEAVGELLNSVPKESANIFNQGKKDEASPKVGKKAEENFPEIIGQTKQRHEISIKM